MRIYYLLPSSVDEMDEFDSHLLVRYHRNKLHMRKIKKKRNFVLIVISGLGTSCTSGNSFENYFGDGSFQKAIASKIKLSNYFMSKRLELLLFENNLFISIVNFCHHLVNSPALCP